MKRILLGLAMVTFAAATWDWSLDYCESWSCRHSLNECWTPTCGLESYATNRDFFTFYFRDQVRDYSFDQSLLNGLYRKFRKRQRRRVKAFQKQLKEIKLQRKRLRALVKSQRKLMWRKIRNSFGRMKRRHFNYYRGFDGFSHCTDFFNCFHTGYYYKASDGADGDGDSDVSGDADFGMDEEEGSGEVEGDGDQESGDSEDVLVDVEEDGPEESEASSELTDNFAEMEEVIEQRGDVIRMIRQNSERHVSALSLYLNSNHDDDARNILLYGDWNSCGGDCLTGYNNLYIVWNSLLARLKRFYYRRLPGISGCGRRKAVLRKAFLGYCRPYPSVIRSGLVGYYDYLINWDGCGSIHW